MPLIVLCGYPSSGKSTLATKLVNYFTQEHGLQEVHIVREEDHLAEHKNNVLDDSRKEKMLRGQVKSEAQRLINQTSLVIIDALNYIKGYRYELFCMSKGVPTRQVTIQCDIPEEMAWDWKQQRPEKDQYSRTVFDNIIKRYELPDPQNRWDSPFFSLLPNEELDYDNVYYSLFNKKPPKPNLSTKCNPVAEGSFLPCLEKVTTDIINTIITKQKKIQTNDDEQEDELEVPHSSVKFLKPESTISLPQLTRLKRQFITFNKVGTVKGDVGDMFVQYLNAQCKELG